MTTPRAYLAGDIPVLGPIGVAVTGISNAAVSVVRMRRDFSSGSGQ
jgi:hypothetical protein